MTLLGELTALPEKPRPLPGFKGATSKERGGAGDEGKGQERRELGRDGKGGAGMQIPISSILL